MFGCRLFEKLCFVDFFLMFLVIRWYRSVLYFLLFYLGMVYFNVEVKVKKIGGLLIKVEEVFYFY